jgi:histone-lysine N-methyltransferase SETD3
MRAAPPLTAAPASRPPQQDPNSDLKEIFDVIEAIPTAPKKLLDGLLSWARGEDDPDWKKRQPPR